MNKCLLLLIFISLVYSQPTDLPTRTLLYKREVTDLVDLHHTRTQTHLTTTSATTTTATTATTATPEVTSSPIVNGSHVIPAWTPDWYDAVYGSQQGIRPEMASLGAILIALGLFLCVMGFRLFKPMLIIMGLLTFGSMTWIALANNKPSTHYANDSITMITVPAGLGVLGAILYFQFWYIAIYLVGSLGGLALAAFICTWKSGMVLVTGILTFFAARPMVFFSTSFVGAYVVMLGVDCLARQGYLAGFELLFNRHQIIEYSLSKYVYVLLAMTIVLFLISMAWQMIYNAAHQLGLHVIAAVKGKTVEEEAKEEGDMPASIHIPHHTPNSHVPSVHHHD
ncbi:hypothetical protein G6F56_007090 [Rhizopus delemar]|nr:hypothetical protein G6F56_007090 [Rhizopus delemar]